MEYSIEIVNALKSLWNCDGSEFMNKLNRVESDGDIGYWICKAKEIINLKK